MSYRPPRIAATTVPDSPTVDGSIPTVADNAARASNVRQQRADDANTEATASNMQGADARREIPRARQDNFNENSGRTLTPSGETITPPSVFSHRTNRRNANQGISRFNPAQKRSISAFINPQTQRQTEIRDLVNQHFENGGKVSDLSPAAQRYVRQLDGGIQKVERENDRNHVVFTTVNLPDGVTKDKFLDSMRSSSRYHQHLLGYTRANHDINKVNPNAPDAQDDSIYVQIETSRGMYVGNQGSSGHMLPRGLELEPVNVGEFDVQDSNGNTVKKTVIQMREVRQNERTRANS